MVCIKDPKGNKDIEYLFFLSFFLTRSFMSCEKRTLSYWCLSEPFSTGLEKVPFSRHTQASLSGHVTATTSTTTYTHTHTHAQTHALKPTPIPTPLPTHTPTSLPIPCPHQRTRTRIYKILRQQRFLISLKRNCWSSKSFKYNNFFTIYPTNLFTVYPTNLFTVCPANFDNLSK